MMSNDSTERIHKDFRTVRVSDAGEESSQSQINVFTTIDQGNPLIGAGDGVDYIKNSYQLNESNALSTIYDKITNESQLTTTEPFSSETTETLNLYKMKAIACRGKSSPEKIEFRLHKKLNSKRNHNLVCKTKIKNPRRCRYYSHNKLSKIDSDKQKQNHSINQQTINQTSYVQRLWNSLSKMTSRTPEQPPMKFNENEIKNSNFKKQRQVSPERMDIYYFDHGNSAYFRTTDCPPAILSELLAQQTTHYATRFWAEIFGSLHIGVTFFITFFLQAYRFLLHSIIRAILVGFLQMTSDYFIKPLLTVIFNGFIQPPLILCYNLFSSICDMLEPIAKIFDNFLKPIANVLQSIRLVNFNMKKDTITNEAKTKENA